MMQSEMKLVKMHRDVFKHLLMPLFKDMATLLVHRSNFVLPGANNDSYV